MAGENTCINHVWNLAMHVAGNGSYKVAPYSSARSLHDRIIHLEWASKLKDYEFRYATQEFIAVKQYSLTLP